MGALVPFASIGWKVIDRFHIGGSFAISPHGVGIALGFLAGAYVFIGREAPRRGYPDEAVGVAAEEVVDPACPEPPEQPDTIIAAVM